MQAPPARHAAGVPIGPCASVAAATAPALFAALATRRPGLGHRPGRRGRVCRIARCRQGRNKGATALRKFAADPHVTRRKINLHPGDTGQRLQCVRDMLHARAAAHALDLQIDGVHFKPFKYCCQKKEQRTTTHVQATRASAMAVLTTPCPQEPRRRLDWHRKSPWRGPDPQLDRLLVACFTAPDSASRGHCAAHGNFCACSHLSELGSKPAGSRDPALLHLDCAGGIRSAIMVIMVCIISIRLPIIW